MLFYCGTSWAIDIIILHILYVYERICRHWAFAYIVFIQENGQESGRLVQCVHCIYVDVGRKKSGAA